MNWEVIPEIFYDLIGRIIPGSFLLILAVLIDDGVRPGIEGIFEQASAAPAVAILLTILLAYFAAILMKQLWDLASAGGKLGRKTTRGDPLPNVYDVLRRTASKAGGTRETTLPDSRLMLSKVRRYLPGEGYRLLKIQAEKNLCEVMIPGLVLLAAFDGWLMVAGSIQPSWRLWLLVPIALAIPSFGQWRKNLEAEYLRSLCAVWLLLELFPPEPSAPTEHGAPKGDREGKR